MTPSINQVAHLMDKQLRNTADDIEDDASVTFSDGSPSVSKLVSFSTKHQDSGGLHGGCS